MTGTLESSLVSIPLHGVPVAAAALDANGVIAAANHRFARLCGWSEGGSPQHLADVVAQQYRPAVIEAFDTLSALPNQATHNCRIRALRAKPPDLWLSIDLMRIGPAAIVPYVAFAHAIAGRRRIDTPPPIQESGPGTRTTAARGTPGLKRWPPLLMTLSHELRGPLTAICGWAQMAAVDALPRARRSRALTVIARNAATLSEMIENLFDLSRQANGSLILTRDVIDLNRLALLTVESALPVAKTHEVTLTGRTSKLPLLVSGDPVRLKQIVRNLVENAIKFTPPGGHVQVQTASVASVAELVVRDDGCGISPDFLPVIFEPFRHGDSTVRPSDNGLGLGLALVRELVQLHGGEVRALSKGEGHGSTFIVKLPMINTAAVVTSGSSSRRRAYVRSAHQGSGITL